VRGSKAKVLRRFAKSIANADGLPIRTYKVMNEQVKYFTNPLLKEPIEYSTATIYLGESVRAVYKKLKSNLKIKE
jgi:hypothetical protein